MQLTSLQRRLLDAYQRDLPLVSRPFAAIAVDLNSDEQTIIDNLNELQARGVISRVGPVIRPHTVGVSTLVAMSVPEQQLEEVAALVSAYPEVNHNYQREHRLNLWFVLTADDAEHLEARLIEIERRTGISVLTLPMIEDYYIDLGFPIGGHA